MGITAERPLAVYYEHPDWFKPLFAELDRRAIPWVELGAAGGAFEIGGEAEYSLLLNRMSPSAQLRGAGHAIFSTLAFLAEMERRGVRVINGSRAYATEISKAGQLSLLHSLGLPYPRARVINRASQAPAAAAGLRLPLVVKPNVGGSGAGVRRFESLDELHAAVPDLDLGLDSTALVQEFIPAESGRIVRVEVLGGEYLYAIRIYTSGDSFDLCPADVCQKTDGTALNAQVCAADAPSRGLSVEAYEPPAAVVAQVERVLAAAGIDVGGVEYLVDARDGRHYFYDVNALSNFVADAPNVIGFDPFARLVDFLESEAGFERMPGSAGVAVGTPRR
jgi:biotin carboxylase